MGVGRVDRVADPVDLAARGPACAASAGISRGHAFAWSARQRDNSRSHAVVAVALALRRHRRPDLGLCGPGAEP